MRIDDFNYELPEELIAQTPIEPRDSSRLLLLNKTTGEIGHSHFYKLGQMLKAGDVLVINDTKVLPARIYCKKTSGAAIELLLLKQIDQNHWQTLARPGKKASKGAELLFDIPDITAEVVDFSEDGTRIVRFDYSGNFFNILEKVGQMPLPPYIKTKLRDGSRYQPVYAREAGSAAAPTAGLHFTKELINDLKKQGIIFANVLLHVGLGTFRPVKADNIEEHIMHKEYYEVNPDAAAIINTAKARGGRLISVGTTSTRTLETASNAKGEILPGFGWTDSYIYPGYQFKAVDGLITNFHLPKSTLLMLVSALAGKDKVMSAYRQAILEKYRFFSFGDAMLIL